MPSWQYHNEPDPDAYYRYSVDYIGHDFFSDTIKLTWLINYSTDCRLQTAIFSIIYMNSIHYNARNSFHPIFAFPACLTQKDPSQNLQIRKRHDNSFFLYRFTTAISFQYIQSLLYSIPKFNIISPHSLNCRELVQQADK